MVAIMVGSKPQIVLEADGTLARPSRLRQHEMIPSGGGARRKSPRAFPGIPPLRNIASQQPQQGRGDVDLIVQARIHPRAVAGKADDHRHVGGVLVGSVMVAVHVELTQVLPVVTRDDDHCVIEDILVGHLVEEPPQVLVREPDARVVAVEHAPHTVHIWELPRLTRIVPPGVIGRETHRLPRAVWAVATIV